jgi:peptidase E
MNRKIASTLVIAAAALAGNAFADDITVDTTPFAGTKSRVEVQAELAQYKAAGVNPWSTQYNPLKQFKSAKTREAVVAEYIAARDEVAALNSEDSGSAYLAQGQGRTADPSTTLAGQPRAAQ